MIIPRFRYILLVILILGVISACNLQASKAPTAFTFPTPNLTVTAIYHNLETQLAPSVSPVALASPTSTQPTLPTYTSIPVVTATTAPVVSTSTPPPPATLPPTATLPPLFRSVGKMVATFFESPPIIDGNISKWGLRQYPADYVVFGKAEWVDAADLDASVMVGWDYNNLYLGVHVKDSRYVQNSSGQYLYLGDSLEVLMDTNLQADFYVKSLSPDDFQLGISPGSPTPGNDPEAYLWFPANIKGSRSKVHIAAEAVDGGYDVEVAIPWSVFEISPLAGQHYGFAFSVSDNDKRTDDVQQSMVSSVPGRSLINPTTWGDLQLGQP